MCKSISISYQSKHLIKLFWTNFSKWLLAADLNASLECHSFPDVDSTATKTTPYCEQHWPEPSPSFFYTFVTLISQPQTYECRHVGWKSQKAQIGSIKVISLRHHPALSIGWVSLLTSATNSSSKVKSPVSIPRFSFFSHHFYVCKALLLNRHKEWNPKHNYYSCGVKI